MNNVGKMTLYDLLSLTSFGLGLTIAFTTAQHASASPIVIGASMIPGLVAGIAAFSGLNRVGKFLYDRTSHEPPLAPTFRGEFPFMLLYLGILVGVFASITIVSWLGLLLWTSL